jgi:uncharacterized Zn finger protein (UPF0148 family)
MSQPQCPKCSAALKDDYGMVSCPSCGTLVFVDMDGMAQISQEHGHEHGHEQGADAEVEAKDPAILESIFAHSQNVDLASLEEPHQQPENHSVQEAPVQFEPPVDLDAPTFDGGSPESQLEGASPAEFEVPPDANAEFNMDGLLGYEQPHSEGENSSAQGMEFGAPGDPLGISDYANSEISQGKDGILTFKILISGIDSKEMRDSLRSAIDDQRFGWDPNEIMSRISKGSLQIDNVASVKAVILINRIKRMPVKVRWEQYAITNMESN